MNKNKVQKTIYFSPIQVELGEKKAISIGMNFSDWIKYLVTKEIEPLSEFYESKRGKLSFHKDKDVTDVDIIDQLRKDSAELNSDYQDLPY